MFRSLAMTRPYGALVMLLAGSTALLLALACGDDGEGDEPSPGSPQTVTLQLDWTPNTNHIGVYVALANGWYEEAGLELDILPYGDTNPDAVVANGQADVAVSFPPNVIYSRAVGLELTSIAAVLQRTPAEIAVLEESDIETPRDLDGKIYAGFGLPHEEAEVKSVIRADGGNGEFDVVTLQTLAYEALYSGDADFAIIFSTWEGIEAGIRDVQLRTFRFDEYGVPEFPGVVFVARTQAVEEESAKLATFLEVTRRGYEFATENPDEASQTMLDYLPDAFPEPELVLRSTRELASYFVEESRPWGEQDSADWQAFTHWFFEQGLVLDDRDNVIEHEDDLPGGPLFSNDLLPGG